MRTFARSTSHPPITPSSVETPRLLVVCDDRALGERLVREFRQRELTVSSLTDSESVATLIASFENARFVTFPDVVMLRFERMHSADLERVHALRRRLQPLVVINVRSEGSSGPHIRADIEVSPSCDVDDLLTIALNLESHSDRMKQSGVHRASTPGHIE